MTRSYDLIVIGAGMAGVSAANKCASKGWKVAIVDALPYGGTCALRGCDRAGEYRQDWPPQRARSTGARGGTVYRQRIHLYVRDREGWNQVVAVANDLNGMAERLNVPVATLWTETIGVFNHIVVEIDFVDLAAFEAANKATESDPEWLQTVGRLQGVTVDDKGYTELLEQATPVGG